MTTAPASARFARMIPWIFAALLFGVIVYWIMQPYRETSLPPAIPSMPAAHQAPAVIAPPKGVAVGKPVMAAVQAHQKDLKQTTPP